MKRISAFVISAAILFSLVAAASASDAPDVIKLKKDIEISAGTIVNDVIVVDGNLTVLGRIEGNAVVIGGVMTLKSGAYIGGDALVVGEVLKDPASTIVGKITQVYVPGFFPSVIDFFRGGWVAFWVVLGILALVGFLGLSVLIIALVPRHMDTIVLGLERSFFVMFLWGLLWMALVIPIAILLVVSIVGIVLIPLELFLAALAVLVGYIASAIFIGNKIFASAKKTVTPLLSAILGIVILFFIGFIPIIGAVVKVVFMIAGYGAVITSRMGSVKTGTDIT